MYLKAIVTGTTGILSIGGSLMGAHYSTKETIENTVGTNNLVLNENASIAWSKLSEKIKQQNSSPKSDEFINVKKQNSELNATCSTVAKQNYKSLFYENKNLLKDFYEYCTIKINGLLENKFQLKNGNVEDNIKEKVKEKLTSLKTHDESSKGKLNETLNRLKTNQSSEKEIKDLVEWCELTYKYYFSSENSNNWKLSKEYCVSS